MNSLIVLRILGVLLLCESVAMLPSIFIALIYGEDTVLAFGVSILITATVGYLLFLFKAKARQ